MSAAASTTAAAKARPEHGWAVIIPVKPAARGKSRLDVPGIDRVALARAIALDTIAAAAACPDVARVFVVTSDASLPVHARDIPALRFVPEDAPAGLNCAIARGADAAGTSLARAALLGDVPALRPADLSAALRAASGVPRAVVADAEGAGSTLVTAAGGTAWESAFGEGSFSAHVARGFAPLRIADASTLRRDVDTADQLRDAAALGLGAYTAALMAQSAPHTRSAPRGG